MIVHPAYVGQELPFNPGLDYETTKWWLRKRYGSIEREDFEDRYHTAWELFLRWTPPPDVLPLTVFNRIFLTCHNQVTRTEPLDHGEEYYQEEVDYENEEPKDHRFRYEVPDYLVFTPDEHRLAFRLQVHKFKLSKLDIRILYLKLQGYTDQEVSSEIGMTRAGINYIYINRILPSIREVLQ